MSDFDKFFAERLHEEVDFPLREKNWKALSQRLDTVGVGTVATAVTALKYWKAAVLGLALISGVLVWKALDLREENAKLREQIEQQSLMLEKPPVAIADQPKENTPRINSTATNSGTTEANVNTQGAHIGRASHGYQPASEKAGQSHARNAQPKQKQLAPTDQLPGNSGGTRNESVVHQAAESGSAHQQPASPLSESVVSQTNEPRLSIPMENEPSAETEIPTVIVMLQPLPPTLPSSLPLPEHKLDQPIQPVLPLMTKPFREKAGRFRAGVQGLAAVPSPQPGSISPLTGVGAAVEYAPLRNIWVSVSADWLSYDVQGKDYLPPQFFHEPQPKDPFGGGPSPHQHPLLEVAGHQRMQLLNLGIRYVLPLRCRLRPSVQVAHTWARLSPEVYSFVFEDDKPGGPNPQSKPPIYLSKPVSAQTISNIWRMGIAVEHETDNWVFRAGVDWVENSTASKPVFDAALVQGSVLYKF